MKTQYFLRSTLLFLTLSCYGMAFGQSPQPTLLKDSTAVEALSPYLKKVLQSTATQFNLPIEYLDTNTLTAHYQIWEYENRGQYAVLVRKELRSTMEEDDYQSLKAALLFDQEEFAEKTIPRLEVREKMMGGELRTSVRIYSDSYWLGIQNYTMLSCGYFFEQKLAIFDGKRWTDIAMPEPEETTDWLMLPGINGHNSKL